MISPHFVCLSMIVSSRAWSDPENFSACDGLAYAIERENDPDGDLPPLVLRSVELMVRAMGRKE